MFKSVVGYRILATLILSVGVLTPALAMMQSEQSQPLRDPTMPVSWQTQQQISLLDAGDGLHLTRIRYGEDNQTAVINGNTVAAGQKIGNYRVVTILPNQVELMSSTGERVQLQLFKSLKHVVNEGSR